MLLYLLSFSPPVGYIHCVLYTAVQKVLLNTREGVDEATWHLATEPPHSQVPCGRLRGRASRAEHRKAAGPVPATSWPKKNTTAANATPLPGMRIDGMTR